MERERGLSFAVVAILLLCFRERKLEAVKEEVFGRERKERVGRDFEVVNRIERGILGVIAFIAAIFGDG